MALVLAESIVDEILSLAAGSAVAYRDGLNLVVVNHAHEGYRGLGIVTLGRMGVDNLVVDEVALSVETRYLASVGIAGVDGHGALLTQWG